MPLSEKTIQATINTVESEWRRQQSNGANRFQRPAVALGGQLMKEDHRSLVMTEDAAMHMSDNYMARSRTTVSKWPPPHVRKRHWKITKIRVPVIPHVKAPIITPLISLKAFRKRSAGTVLRQNDRISRMDYMEPRLF